MKPAHHELPTHRKLYRLFQDCEKTLAPETSDQFDREANNFARFVLFQDDRFAKMAADCEFGHQNTAAAQVKIWCFGLRFRSGVCAHKSPGMRCLRLEPIEYVQGIGAKADLRRIEPSPE